MALPRMVIDGNDALGVSTWEGYERLFNDASKGDIGQVWIKPWAGEYRHSRFWGYSLAEQYELATANPAWRAQIPLRHRADVHLETERPEVSARAERFVYPTGIGVVVTATYEGEPLTEASLVEVVRALTDHASFRRGHDGALQSLASTMTRLLDELGTDLAGGDARAQRSEHARSLVTILGTTPSPSPENTAVPPTAAPFDEGQAVALLAQLANPRARAVPSRIQKLSSRAAEPHALAVFDRAGQAAWSPQVSGTDDGVSDMQCYHRNHTMAALQVDILLRTVEVLSKASLGEASSEAQEHARRTLTLVGRIYGKAKGAYRTEFSFRSIDGSGLVDTINELRLNHTDGLGPLSAPLQ